MKSHSPFAAAAALLTLSLPGLSCVSGNTTGETTRGASSTGSTGAGGVSSSAGTGGSSSASGIGAGGAGGMDGGAVAPDAGAGGMDGGAVASDAGADPCGASNPAVVPLPTIGTGTFAVGDYGAVGDGKTDATAALQAALDAAMSAGGGTVVVPAGTFLSGPIVVGSATRLELSAGAELEMLPMGTYPGTTAFLTASANAHDIALTGSGTIEGQGQAWWNALTATPTLARPQEVSLEHVTRVLISGIRLQNPPEEHIWVKSDTDVTITGITISTLAVAGQHAPNNTDGVDISANGVFFCNNDIACGDDNVVMEGTNIYVAYSKFGVGHGCSIGSDTGGGVSGVTVDHVTFDGTTSGVRMKSARGRGGLVQNLSYSNLTMTNVQNPVFITSYYPTLPADPTADPGMAVTATTPEWKNITLTNVTATGSSNAGIFWGLPEAKLTNIVYDATVTGITTTAY